MHTVPSQPARNGFSWGAGLKWLSSCLLILVLVAWVWPVSQPAVQAAEPDLSLLKEAYRVSTISSGPTESSPAVIPAAAFHADGSNRNWFFGFNSGYIYPTDTGSYCGVVALSLPQGVRVTSFTADLMDNDAVNSVYAYLYARPFASLNSSTNMAMVGSTIQSENIQTLVTTSIAAGLIDNNLNTYHIGVCLWGSSNLLQFYSVRVGYDIPIYLPVVIK